MTLGDPVCNAVNWQGSPVFNPPLPLSPGNMCNMQARAARALQDHTPECQVYIGHNVTHQCYTPMLRCDQSVCRALHPGIDK